MIVAESLRHSATTLSLDDAKESTSLWSTLLRSMTCCVFLTVLLGQLVCFAARTDDRDEIVKATGSYQVTIAKAEQTLLAAFEKMEQPELGFPKNMKVLKWTIRENGLELDEAGNNGVPSVGKLENSTQNP